MSSTETTPTDKKDNAIDYLQNNARTIGIVICILIVLSCSVGLFLYMMSRESADTSQMPIIGQIPKQIPTQIPTHYTIELKYGDGVNPYNNLLLPPVIPKPPEYF